MMIGDDVVVDDTIDCQVGMQWPLRFIISAYEFHRDKHQRDLHRNTYPMKSCQESLRPDYFSDLTDLGIHHQPCTIGCPGGRASIGIHTVNTVVSPF